MSNLSNLEFIDAVLRAKCKSVGGLGAKPPEDDDILELKMHF